MTVTETRADAVEAPAADPLERRGFAALMGSGDPRTIGKLYVGTSVIFLLLAGVLGALLSIERADDQAQNLLEGAYDQIFSLHSIGGLFLFLLPLLIGLLAVVVPLQIGAATVAFPRALAASYWTYLTAGGVLVASFAIDGGPGGGDAQAVDLFIASFVLVLGAITVAAVTLTTTVLTLRAPGMSLRRTPLLSWSTVVAGAVWVFTFPVLVAVLVLLYVDHRYGQTFLGGSDGVYPHVKWVFLQPALYVAAIPALGAIGDIVPVFARRRHVQHGLAMTAIGLFGIFSYGGATQMAVGIDSDNLPDEHPWQFELPWIIAGVGALVALLLLTALWLDTLRQGKVRFASPVVFAGAGLLMLLVGAAQGAVGVFEDLDVQNISWQTGQAHYLLLGATIAAFGGVTYWSPKLYGTLVRDRGAAAAGALLLLGTIGLAFLDLVSGILQRGNPSQDTLDALNIGSAVGGGVAILGALLFVVVLLVSVVRGGDAPGDDPWEGHTLEWATASPPPVGHFASLPEITSEAPLYDARHAAGTTTEASA